MPGLESPFVILFGVKDSKKADFDGSAKLYMDNTFPTFRMPITKSDF